MCTGTQAVEGSLAGLEVAQGENMRRLSMSLNSALVDAEASLQVGSAAAGRGWGGRRVLAAGGMGALGVAHTVAGPGCRRAAGD